MNFKNVSIESIAYSLPDEVWTSADVEVKLAPVYERLSLPKGRLELMTGIRERRFWPPNTTASYASAQAGEEVLAKSSFEGILKLVGPFTEEGLKISNIMSDELLHHGMAKKYFLNHYPALQPWQLMIYRTRETINNKGRKIYDANLKFLDKLLTPLYKTMAYLAGTISKKLNLNEFKRKGKNLMNISPNSIL